MTRPVVHVFQIWASLGLLSSVTFVLSSSPVPDESKVLGILSSIDKRLQNLEQTSTRLPRLEPWFELVNKRLDQLDLNLHQWALRWGKLEESTKPETFSEIPPCVRYPISDERLSSKIDSLGADVLTGVDDIMEKILRLEERMILHERTSSNQLEKIGDMANSGLELMVSSRTESATDARKTVRVIDSRILDLATKIENEFSKFLYLLPSMKKERERPDRQLKRNTTDTEPSDVHTLLRRVRTNRSKSPVFEASKSASMLHKMKQKDAPFVSIATPVLSSFSRTADFKLFKKDYEAEATELNNSELSNCSATHFVKKLSTTLDESFAKQVQQQGSLFTSKLANMYEDLSKQGRLLASEMFIIGNVVNQTKVHMDEGFRTLLAQQDRHIFTTLPGSIPTDCSAALEMTTREILDNIKRKMSDLDDRVHVELEALRMTQAGLIEVLHRANPEQQWDSILEVLERLLLVMENNSLSAQKEMGVLKMMLQRHGEQVESLFYKATSGSNETLTKKNQTMITMHDAIENNHKLGKKEPAEDDEEKIAETQDYAYVDPEEQSD